MPNQYVLNRWTKDALKKPLYNFCGNLEGVEKVEKHKVVGDIWAKFLSCVSLAEDKPDRLNMLLEKLTVVEKELEAKKHEDHQQSKEKHLELLLGSKDIELNILPLEKSSNKGSGSGKRKKIEIVHLKEKIFSEVNDEDNIPVEDAVLLTAQTMYWAEHHGLSI
ncbi:Alanine--tRNA ligase [Bienertia sinuspersici]